MSEWIDVKDRLPETGQRVIVTLAKKYADDKQVFIDTYGDRHGGGWQTYLINYVIAWQPLPEPYEAKDD